MHFVVLCPSVPSVEGVRALFVLLVRIKERIIAREVVIAPSRLVRRVSEISAGAMRGRRLVFVTPAALIRMSTFAFFRYQISSFLFEYCRVGGWVGCLPFPLLIIEPTSLTRIHRRRVD